MEKMSPKRKLSVVRLYLSGLSYDEIATKSGVSKGSAANIVAELKAGSFPEAADAAEQIELLRELSLDLKHSGLSPGQCAVGLAILNRVKECGLDAADIDRWPAILKAAGNEVDARVFVEAVYRIQNSMEISGLTLEQADEKISALEDRAAQLEPLTRQVDERQKGLAELGKRRNELGPVVTNLEQKYALLSPRVKDLEKREGELSRWIKDEQDAIDKAAATLAALREQKQQLQDAGFSLEGLAEFNDRTRAIAARHKLPIASLRERLLHELETLDKGLGLEALIQSKETKLKQYQQAIISAKKEREGLDAAIVTLGQQRAALESRILAARQELDDEVARAIPAVRQVIAQLAEEHRLGNKAAFDDLQHVRDQALEVGKEIGRYEGLVQANAWLVELQSLVRGEDSPKAHRVRIILLLVLRGAHSWMKRNPRTAGSVTPVYTTGRLIGELEQWRTS